MKINKSLLLYAAVAMASTCCWHPGICRFWRTSVSHHSGQLALNSRSTHAQLTLNSRSTRAQLTLNSRSNHLPAFTSSLPENYRALRSREVLIDLSQDVNKCYWMTCIFCESNILYTHTHTHTQTHRHTDTQTHRHTDTIKKGYGIVNYSELL
jgi:hypothetical protein